MWLPRKLPEEHTAQGSAHHVRAKDETDERAVMAVAERRERRTTRAIRALSPRRPARRLWRYLLAERRTLRQGLGALLLSTAAGLVAGVALGSISHTLVLLPSLFVLIPAAVGMKGTIFGAIGARLGTSTHAGLFEI